MLGRSSALALLLLLSGCGEQQAADGAPPPVETFSCGRLLIGLETVYCHEDVVGPGTLSVSFEPDPKETSWEIAVRGLAALAEQCEFHGQFDQTRLSALQGRGRCELVCPISANIDRQYHELSFENLSDTINTSITVTARFRR